MNAVNRILRILVSLAVLTSVGCSRNAEPSEELSASEIVDRVNSKFHGLDGLKEAVSTLYISAADHDWARVFSFRDMGINSLADEKAFVSTMDEKMADFELLDLEFQMIEATRNPASEVTKCRVVVRIVQNPHKREHVSVVNWFKEAGNWKCDSIGLRGSPLLGKVP